jgi:hypothetical protein
MTSPWFSDHEKFARVVETLRPWLSDVAGAGGWAHRLHRLHAFAEGPDDLPLMTTDVDVALGGVPGGAGNMREALRASGFVDGGGAAGECDEASVAIPGCRPRLAGRVTTSSSNVREWPT